MNKLYYENADEKNYRVSLYACNMDPDGMLEAEFLAASGNIIDLLRAWEAHKSANDGFRFTYPLYDKAGNCIGRLCSTDAENSARANALYSD